MFVSQQLAAFVKNLKYESLPSEVVEYARMLWLDTFGVMAMFSQGAHPSTSIRDFVVAQGGNEEATIAGTKRKVPTANAAWVNATLSVGGGLDGYHQASATHLLAITVPACAAAAERTGPSGKELITAFVAGAECMIRISLGLGSDYLLGKGLHPTSIAGPFGAALCAGRLLGLSEPQLTAALGLAGVQAAGLTVWGAEREIASYQWQVGKACHSGLLSVLLAARGYIACEPIFEHSRGFVSSHAPQADLTRMTRGLGEDYEIMNATIHSYNTGIVTYTSLDAFMMILDEHPEITPETIDRVSVGLPNNAMPLVGNPEYPESATKAHLSTRYLIALVPLLREKMREGIDLGVDKWRLDPDIQARFQKVEVHADSELDPIFPKFMPAKVEVRTTDGKVYRKRFDGPTKGHPPNRLTSEEVEAKFMRLAGDLYGHERAEKLIKSIRKITEIDNVAPLIAGLCRLKS